jgi:hypothetical protein
VGTAIAYAWWSGRVADVYVLLALGTFDAPGGRWARLLAAALALMQDPVDREQLLVLLSGLVVASILPSARDVQDR